MLMRRNTQTKSVLAGVMLVPACLAHATDVQVDSGQTLTAADLLAGSFLGQQFTLDAGTTFEINDGGVIGPLGVFGAPFDLGGSTVNVNSGALFASTDPGSSNFVQTVTRNVNINLFDGGTIGENFFAESGTNIHISGGQTLGNLALFAGAEATVTGGTVGELFTAFTGARINISGGNIVNNLVAVDFSRIDISGGTFGSEITTFDGSVTNISGGVIGDEFVAFDGAIVNLFVTSLKIDGVDVALNLDEELLIEQRGGSVLEAVLADGSALEFTLNGDFVSGDDVFEIGTRLTATLVPAPGAAALLGLGGLLAGRRRR